MNKKILLAISTVVIIGIVATAYFIKDSVKNVSSGDIEVLHELGTTTLSKNPRSIAVFDYGVLDILDFMDINVTGVPKSNLPEYLNKYSDEKYINVGDIKEPDIEKLFEIKPDLIIISGRQKDFYDQLSDIAPTIYMPIDNEDYMMSFEKNCEIIAAVFDNASILTDEINNIKTKLSNIEKTISDNDYNSLIILSNNGDLSAYGGVSRFGIIHKYMGFKEIDDIPESTHGNSISYEYILNSNPDYIFVVDRSAITGGDISAQSSFNNDIIKATDAYKNDRIIFLDPVIWYTSVGGITSTNMMIDEVTNGIK